MVGIKKGARLSESHKKSIAKGMQRAAAEGRLKGFSDSVKRKGLDAIASLTDRQILDRAKKAGDTMRGRPQRMDKCTAAKEDNQLAKHWLIISPAKDMYVAKNLNNFVREHKHLFDPRDTEQAPGVSGCNASRCLNRLTQIDKKTGKPRAKSWKGWQCDKIKKSMYELLLD